MELIWNSGKAFLLFLSFPGYFFVVYRFGKVRKWFVPVVSMSGIGLVLFWGGLLNCLALTADLLLLGGVAGSIPILALMATITAALARQMNVHPIKLAPFEVFGAIAGAVTPVSMSGVLIESLAVDAGLPFSYLPSYLTSVLCNFVPCLACFFLFRWHTHKSIPGFEGMKPEKLDRPQLITLFGIILMIAMTVFFGIDVGLASIFCSVLLLFLRVSDEKASLNGVPWGTLVMISGMGILISMVDDLHGIDLIANFLEGFLTPALAPVVYVLLSGVMSLVSSAQGVVMPTLIPTIPIFSIYSSLVKFNR